MVLRLCRKEKGKEKVLPSEREKLTSKEKHPLRVFIEPEDAISFHSQVHDSANGTFNGSAPDGDTGLSEEGIAHSQGMFFKERNFRVNRFSAPSLCQVIKLV